MKSAPTAKYQTGPNRCSTLRVKGNAHIMLLHHAKKDSRDDLDAAIGSTAIRGLAYT